MEGKITRHRMDCERFVEELQELGFTLEDAQALRIEGSVNDWKDEQARLMAEIAELGQSIRTLLRNMKKLKSVMIS